MAKSIMVVDDSFTVRHLVATTLGPHGFEVVEAQDGVEGIERLAGHPDLALLICDVNMPRMDGIEMITRLKEQGHHPELPIVMLTTESSADAIRRAKSAGAKAWLTKPFKAELLLAVVAKLAIKA